MLDALRSMLDISSKPTILSCVHEDWTRPGGIPIPTADNPSKAVSVIKLGIYRVVQKKRTFACYVKTDADSDVSFFATQSTFIWLGRLWISPLYDKKCASGERSSESYFSARAREEEAAARRRCGAGGRPHGWSVVRKNRCPALVFWLRSVKFTDVRAIWMHWVTKTPT